MQAEPGGVCQMSVVDLSATPEAAPAGRSSAGIAGPIATVDVLDDLAAAAPAWRELAAHGAIATAFQRFEWIDAWQRNVGTPEGFRPLVVIGRDRTGAPAFLWPFVHRPGTLTVARFPGLAHSGLNIGLWRRDVAAALTAADILALLRQAGRRHGIDLFRLERQPPRWRGLDNPFARLPHRPTVDDVPSQAFPAEPPEEVFKAVVSRDMRGRLRTKERKLEKLAGYRYLRATTVADADRVLDAFLAQKAAHFAAQGIPDVFAEPGVAAFLRESCRVGLTEGRPGIELHAIEGGGEVIAVMGGVADDHRFSCMFNSYTTSENGRWSPGLILITHIVRDCAARGLAGFDLGPGAASYKGFFCREPENLFDSEVAVSLRGRLAAPLLAGLAEARRRAKQNERVRALVHRLRRLVGGEAPARPD